MKTVRQTFEDMASTFAPEAAAGVNEVYQFDITGEGGGTWYATVKDQTCTVQEGEHASPSLRITMSAPDYLAMATGKLHGQVAYMTGKMKLKGSMLHALTMNRIFTKR